jgi:DNA-binding MurR/RpiR family transcriptional regulator
MSDAVALQDTPTESGNSQTLFIKISDSLNQEIQTAAAKIGVSKSGIVRMALPLGIANLIDRLETTNTSEP